MFITFEGGEGTGKSTQVALLAERLRVAGHDVRLTREPGGTPLALGARALLLYPDQSLHALATAGLVAALAPQDETSEEMLPLTEVLLLSAARTQLVARMRRWLAEGALVVCDRYADATRAYQGAGRGYDLATIATLEHLATGGLRPDLTLLLDLPAEEGQRRRHAASASGGELNRLDREALAFHQRVRAAYLALAAAEPDRWAVIDAAPAPAVVAEGIWSVVAPRLSRA